MFVWTEKELNAEQSEAVLCQEAYSWWPAQAAERRGR